MIRKILISLILLLIAAASVVVTSVVYNGSLEPPELVTNFVDINKVRRITKFRSCAGHTTVPRDGRELKRNMKHYIILYPEYHEENLVEVYAPYDGYVALQFGKEEIWIAQGEKSVFNILPLNQWMVGFTHVLPKEGLRMGDRVKAGELIGHGTFTLNERGYPTFDVLYGTLSMRLKRMDNWTSMLGDLDSVFNHMSPNVLAEYKAKGITPETIIIPKERRDNDPCIYKDGGPYFDHKIVAQEADSVDLR